MHALATELFPFCRSLTGDGVRQTLDVIEREVPLEPTAVPSGTQVYDWMLPREWNVRGARLTGPDGRVVADFADSNLHVLNYSVPVSGTFSLDELRSHLFTDPARPGVIPYRTSYHSENWGFCLPHSVYEHLPAGDYQVEIDSMLEDGELVYAERFLPGETDDEVLLSTHVCHPSLANDNLSGIVLAATLARHLDGQHLRRSHRFVFSPATIGPLTWLSRNEQRLPRIAAGMVVSCVGDPGPFTYKRSRRGDSEIDRAAAAVLGDEGGPRTSRRSAPTSGSSARRVSTSPSGCFRAPDRPFRSTTPRGRSRLRPPQALGESFERYLDVLDVLERNRSFRNLEPEGRAAARRAASTGRRRLVHGRPAALGAEPLRRRARPAGDRRTLWPDVRRGRRRRRRARRSRAASGDRWERRRSLSLAKRQRTAPPWPPAPRGSCRTPSSARPRTSAPSSSRSASTWSSRGSSARRRSARSPSVSPSARS
jgi:aminopeptidase-like protein